MARRRKVKAQQIRHYGLIGFPLSHSFSPGYFSRKFKSENIKNAVYDLYPLSKIKDFVNLPSYVLGLNVTIPYKEEVISYLDEISDEARMIGAVNTIDFRDGKKIGYNTDVFGFEVSLIPLLEKFPVVNALVLGTGGASKAVLYVLDKLKINTTVVSRTRGDIAYDQVDNKVIKEHSLIINTTPLGMYPNTDQFPSIPYEAIGPKHILFDLIYNPKKTLFLIKGEQQGARIKNGLEMLELQAEKAWQIWNQRVGINL